MSYRAHLVDEDGLEAGGLARDVVQRVLRRLHLVRAQDARREHDRQGVRAHSAKRRELPPNNEYEQSIIRFYLNLVKKCASKYTQPSLGGQTL